MFKAIIAFLVIIALTGCDTSSSTTASTKSHKVASSNSILAKEAIREQVYLSMTHDRIPLTEGISDSRLVQLGKENCTTFDKIHLHNKKLLNVYVISFHRQVSKIMSLGDTAWYMGVVIAAFCPQYNHIIQGD